MKAACSKSLVDFFKFAFFDSCRIFQLLLHQHQHSVQVRGEKLTNYLTSFIPVPLRLVEDLGFLPKLKY
jgi:hypothetical protein